MSMRRRREERRKQRQRGRRLTHESRDLASSLADRFRRQAAQAQQPGSRPDRPAQALEQETAPVSLPDPGERINVQSLAIRWFSYDAATETLTVEYRSGDVYAYSGVPLAVMEDVLTLSQSMPTSARSLFRFSWGRFINFDIKPNYSFSKIG